MLKTVELSRAKKTAGIAVTYRAGKGDMFGTCPASCNLNDSGKGAENVDNEYLDALLNAKPKYIRIFISIGLKRRGPLQRLLLIIARIV